VGGAECDLLCFSEKLVHISVETKFTNVLGRNEILGPDFCRVENIEVEFVLSVLRDDLDTKFPFGVGAGFNGLVEVFAVEVWVLPAELECFVPDKGVYSELRGPGEFDEESFSLGIE